MMHCSYEGCSAFFSGYIVFTPVGVELPYCATHRQVVLEYFDSDRAPEYREMMSP